MSRWWKCDLQIATPAWDFSIPQGYASDWNVQSNCDEFAEAYCDQLIAQGVEVVALADHNTGAWIDTMVRIGARKGVVVFPGCEITTGTGSDGVHLIIIGDRSKSSADYDRLLSGHLGFPSASDRFRMSGNKKIPSSSNMSIVDILDGLPDGYLAYAPHALNDNGIASSATVKGDLRWKALHHSRLAAIDVGEGSREGTGFSAQFRRRELDDFPCLKYLPYIRSSDSYAFEHVGRAFTWIRMKEPTIEGLRQAFIDYESRILANDDARLDGFVSKNPNNTRHAWIQSVTLSGELANTDQDVSVDFHPGLNVLIGGRGSGKSTVIAALRTLYSGTDGLPAAVRHEAQAFQSEVFGKARLSSSHFVAISQEKQSVEWTQTGGSLTSAGLETRRTSFKVHVFSQKELFERVRSNPTQPFSASQCFLAMVDDAIDKRARDDGPDSWAHLYSVERDAWQELARALLQVRGEVSHLSQAEAEIQEIVAQVEAFDSDGGKDQRDRQAASVASSELVSDHEQNIATLIESLSGFEVAEQQTDPELLATEQTSPATQVTEETAQNPSEASRRVVAELKEVERELRALIAAALRVATDRLASMKVGANWRAWEEEQQESSNAYSAYLSSMQEKGLRVEDYTALVAKIARKKEAVGVLREKSNAIVEAEAKVRSAWQQLGLRIQERRDSRQELLEKVCGDSGQLKFVVTSEHDIDNWMTSVRELAGFRSDHFIDDVPKLAKWLWHGGEGVEDRARQWREGLMKGNLSELSSYGMRPAFKQKLESLDQTIRLRLAVEVPDDFVEILFLREGGDRRIESDWQSIETGSAGQKTAAMLGFILSHGSEPLILDQPEDDLDSEMVTHLVVAQIRKSRWKRQVIVVSHNANVPVNGDAEQVVVLENIGRTLRVRHCALGLHCGPIEHRPVREDIQSIMEGGTEAFERRERRYKCFMSQT